MAQAPAADAASCPPLSGYGEPAIPRILVDRNLQGDLSRNGLADETKRKCPVLARLQARRCGEIQASCGILSGPVSAGAGPQACPL